ncbi:MAG: carbohydrate porin, partial [Rhizomicrobium sp.]
MRGLLVIAALSSVLASAAQADDLPDWLSLHAQSTIVVQYHPSFRSPYRGANSLSPKSVGDETF